MPAHGSSGVNGFASGTEPAKNVSWGKVGTFLACVALIYTAYITQGWVAELLSRQKFGADGVKFKRMEALIGFQCITCFLWGALLDVFMRKPARRAPPITSYALLGATNVIGPVAGVYALKMISYPAQVLAKSCKSVPIMLMGYLRHGKRYTVSEYASVLAISSGVAMFALSSGKAKGALQNSNPVLGYALVLLNLVLDSFTNTGQDEMKRQYPEVSGLHMMCWTNFWGGLYYAAAFAFTGSGAEVVRFCMEHHEAGWYLLGFCLCGALGQLGIFYTVAATGTLVTSIVCTTRKFFSILLSVLLAGTVLTGQQSFAVALVFGGLLYKSVLRLAANEARKQRTQ
jgi:solute carrier family 35 (UDP-galactose transporter), member B1